MTLSRIVIEPLVDSSALIMTWSNDVQIDDIVAAYHDIVAYLNNSDHPLDVVIDLRQQPIMPQRETVSGALEAAYSHEKIGKWLILGGDTLAHAASNLFYGFTGEQNILWFKAMEDVQDYLTASRPVNPG